jgi:hypothetical protein
MNKKHLPFYTTKEDIFKNLLKMGVLPSISNIYEEHNKPPQFQDLYEHLH